MSEQPSDFALHEIVAVMVHDLNNPIAALGTNLRFLETSLGPSQSADVVETLSDAHMLCEMLRRLVGNLGMLARPTLPQGGRLAFNVAQTAADAVAQLGKLAEASEVKLVLEPAARSKEVFVECDRELCARALDNLVAFAIERAVRRSQIAVYVVKAAGAVVHVRFSSRVEPAEVSAFPLRSRQLQSAFGRGLSLHCARVAATALGGRVDMRRENDNMVTLELTLPSDDKQIA
jgi:signal transduction histidine kinase